MQTSYKRTSLIIFLFLMLSSMASKEEKINLRVMTFNIRYDSPNDAKEGNGWEVRKPRVAQIIEFYNPAIFGLQEALLHQTKYLDSVLVDYKWYGVGRDDGKEKGEYSPVFYNAKMFDLVSSETMWLSETPGKPSKSWDAALPRILTKVQLKHKASGKVIDFFNTHFDHRGEEARLESARLIKRNILAEGLSKPSVLMGDFNASENSAPYHDLISGQQIFDVHQITQNGSIGPKGTFGGFEVCGKEITNRIDHIFTTKEIEVKWVKVINDSFGEKYPSDHFPVMADIEF